MKRSPLLTVGDVISLLLLLVAGIKAIDLLMGW